jgi:beta-mannosidase
VSVLSLFLTPESPVFPLDGDWHLKSADNELGLEQGYADPDFDDSSWEVVRLPHLRHATAEQDTLWYRYHLDLTGFREANRSGFGRTIIRFGGSFYRTRVWLNGVELGLHEGYFQPFGFDITDILRPENNVLAVRCRFLVEAGAFKRKTAVAGIFTDWDCKPYPSQFYPHLPEPNEWTVPIGLWQPVYLYTTGPVIIESMLTLPTVVGADWEAGKAEAAKVQIKVAFCNLIGETQSVETRLTVGIGGEPPQQSTSTKISLAANERREMEYSVTLSHPRLWFPWTHGVPHLYCASLSLNENTHYAQSFGVREIKAVIEPGKWEWWLNGRKIFPIMFLIFIWIR